MFPYLVVFETSITCRHRESDGAFTRRFMGGFHVGTGQLEYIKSLLVKLLSIPSPSGDTEQIIQFLEKECEDIGLPTTRNHKGGLLLQLPGRDSERHRMITAHVDTLGGMVKEILKTGRLRIAK